MFDLTMNRNARRKESRGHRGTGPRRHGTTAPIEALEARLVLSSSRPRTFRPTSSPTSRASPRSRTPAWSTPGASPSARRARSGSRTKGPTPAPSTAVTPTGVSKVRPDGQYPDDRVRAPGADRPGVQQHLVLPGQRQARGLHLRQPERHHLRLEWRHDGHGRSDDPRRHLHRPGDRVEHLGQLPLRRRRRAGPDRRLRRHVHPAQLRPQRVRRPPAPLRARPVQREARQRRSFRDLRARRARRPDRGQARVRGPWRRSRRAGDSSAN